MNHCCVGVSRVSSEIGAFSVWLAKPCQAIEGLLGRRAQEPGSFQRHKPLALVEGDWEGQGPGRQCRLPRISQRPADGRYRLFGGIDGDHPIEPICLPRLHGGTHGQNAAVT